MKKYVLILFLLSHSLSVVAQKTAPNQNAEIQAQIEEIMKARAEMLKSLMDDSSGFEGFDKHFEDMVKSFEQNSFGQGFDMNAGAVVGEYDWRETDTQQILVLKVKQIKDKPLDIKIEKGEIKLKGDVESVDEDTNSKKKSKRITKVHFERVFGIPEGVDQTNPEFENKAGELLIKFKKLVVSKVKNDNKTLPKTSVRPAVVPVPEKELRRPLEKDANDITI